MPGSVTRWRVSPALPLLKFTAVVVLVVLAVSARKDTEWLLLAGVAAVGFAVYGLRDVLAPVRLSADETGVTVVTGYARRRHIPWAAIERIGVREQRSLGVLSQLVEIDAGESLHLFSRYDLGAPSAEVAKALMALRHSAGHSAGHEHAHAESDEEYRGGEGEPPLDATPPEQGTDGVDGHRDHREPQENERHDDRREQQ